MESLLDRSTLEPRVDAFCHALRAAGVSGGDRIAWMAHNRGDLLALGVAARRLGVVTVSLSYRSAQAEVRRLLALARPAATVVDDATADRLPGGHAGPVLNLDHLPIDPAAPVPAPRRADEHPGGGRLGAGASMLFTSGTTGNPKAALRTKGDPALASAIVDGFGITAGTRFLIGGPLYHSGPWTCALMVLDRGGAVGVLPRFDPLHWLAFATRHEVNAGFVTASQLRAVVEAVESGVDRPATLRRVIVSGEPFPAALKVRAVAALGGCLLDCYGSTELGPLTLAPPEQLLLRPDSCGRPFPGVEIAAFDGDRRLPAGEVGLLRARTPLAFDGYLDAATQRPDGTGAGWVTVRDVGYVDADGFVYLVGRDDDMVISGGVNVFPADVEAVLAEHPAIRRCAVVGVPDPRFGRAVAAAIVADEPLTLADLRHWLRGRLADDKRPRYLMAVPELPLTHTDKVCRRSVKALFAARQG